MANVATSTGTTSTSGWIRGTAAALFVYALSGAFLQFVKISGGLPPVMPVVIMASLAVVLGVALLVTGDRRLPALGIALMVIALIGTTPHDIDNLAAANGMGQRIYGVLDLTIMAVTLVVSAAATLRGTASRTRTV